MYMSPEQVRNSRHVDARADIWALGVILHELLAGTPMFEDETLPALCAAIVSNAPPPIRQRRHDVPAEVEAAILRCVEKEPALRFQNVGELAATLLPFSTAASAGRVLAARTTSGNRAVRSMEVTMEGPPSPSQAPPRRRLVWPFALGLVMVGLAVAIWARGRSSPTAAPVEQAISPRSAARPLALPTSVALEPSPARARTDTVGSDTAVAAAPESTAVESEPSPRPGNVGVQGPKPATSKGGAPKVHASASPASVPSVASTRSEEDLLINRR
jgi:serine/threonine-protein kinase